MAKPGEKFYIDARGVKAEGVVTENGFLVFKGSTVIPTHKEYLSKTIVKMRDEAFADGSIVDNLLTRDYEFKSSSTAAYFLFGANASGPQTWKNEDGIAMAKLEKVEQGIIPDYDNEFLSFYKVVGNNEGSKCHYPARLDTYGRGCGHDCSYCYAKSTLYFHGQWNPERPDVADINRIENRIRKLEKGTIVRLGGMTDCFQPCELKNRVTYKTIKLLNKYGIGYLIVTKSHIVADDDYMSILDPKLAHIQITITTTDDKKALEYEKASVPSKRIAAIEKLHKAGFDVAVRLSPYIEGYVDFNILNSINCDRILVEFLRVNPFIKKWFDIDYSNYTLWQDGFSHLPLEAKKSVLKQITGFKEISVCEDYTEHYDYWKENFNPNPDDCCNLKL